MADPTGDTPAQAGAPDAGTSVAVTPSSPAPAPASAEPISPASTDPAPAPAGDGEPPANGNDWATLRDKYAKGDEKILKRLSRYSSQEAVIDALLAAQNKISSGTLRSTLPENATKEEMAAWREENGIPADTSGYDLKDIPLSPEAKAGADEFLKAAHAVNMTPAQVKAAVAWSAQRAEAQLEARQLQDQQITAEADELLREEWGAETKLNKNMILGLLDTAPEGVKDRIMGGRLADGTPITSDVKTLRWLAGIAREINPVATVVPGAGTNSAQVIETEMATMQKLMGDPKSAYWKGPEAEKMQARYRDLITVQEKIRR